MPTTARPAGDRPMNWSHRTVTLLLTATTLLGSLSVTATALGDPELVALLALAGCGLALLGVAITTMQTREGSLSAPAGA